MDRFVSEEEVEAIRKKKQEEWEKKRTADQPLIRPEEPTDNRSLAERLQENADKKQAEFEEKFALKNMIYTGMDEDEFEHVESLAQAEYDRTINRYKREGEEIKEFRKKLRTAPPEERAKEPVVKLVAARRKKDDTSALKSLATAIRRKPANASTESASAKGAAESKKHTAAASTTEAAKPSASAPSSPPPATGGGLGLVAYDSSSDDDDDETTKVS